MIITFKLSFKGTGHRMYTKPFSAHEYSYRLYGVTDRFDRAVTVTSVNHFGPNCDTIKMTVAATGIENINNA